MSSAVLREEVTQFVPATRRVVKPAEVVLTLSVQEAKNLLTLLGRTNTSVFSDMWGTLDKVVGPTPQHRLLIPTIDLYKYKALFVAPDTSV